MPAKRARKGDVVRPRSLVALGLVVTAMSGLAASAEAAPPTLLTVGQTERHLTASWSLAPGAESRVIEAATSPNTGSDGYFFTENVALFDTLESSQTSYLSTSQLNPGLYYVHVGSFQSDCPDCPIREWSNVLTITIPADAPPPDTTRPSLLTGGPSHQDIDTLYVRASMNEAGRLTAKGTVRISSSTRIYRLKSVTRTAPRNTPMKLRLRLAMKAKRSARRAMKRGRTVRARVTLLATDAAGNTSRSTRSIRLLQ
jgi:hypothetical protein